MWLGSEASADAGNTKRKVCPVPAVLKGLKREQRLCSTKLEVILAMGHCTRRELRSLSVGEAAVKQPGIRCSVSGDSFKKEF